jgi:hypothetical protein
VFSVMSPQDEVSPAFVTTLTHATLKMHYPYQVSTSKRSALSFTWLVALFLAAILPASARPQEISAPKATTSGNARVVERSEQLSRLGVSRWHADGYRGRGVKVAILDSGFRGYRNYLGKALPQNVTVHSFRRDGNLEARDSQHGILCGEVVHSLAPGAELLFANWEPEEPEQFLNAALWAREQGARIISCSVIMPSWSDGEGGGDVHKALTRILGAGSRPSDLLCFASAGNIAERHWSGAFRDGGDGFHEWQPGQNRNIVKPWSNEQVSVELYWQPGADYDLFVENEIGAEVARSQSRTRENRTSAVVRFDPVGNQTYQVRVRFARGKPGHFHFVALGAGLDCSTAKGSICFPGDGSEVIAVGAVDQKGRRFAYSSCGPNSSQPKPDVVAPVPFPTIWRSRPFGGTSAAAPQAAALAALWCSRYPGWEAERIRAAMQKSASRAGAGSPDFEIGYGQINLP